MSDPLLTTYENAAFELTELAQDGLMTVETYTVLSRLLVFHSRLSAKIKSDLTFLAGSLNSLSNAQMQEDKSVLSFTSDEV